MIQDITKRQTTRVSTWNCQVRLVAQRLPCRCDLPIKRGKRTIRPSRPILKTWSIQAISSAHANLSFGKIQQLQTTVYQISLIILGSLRRQILYYNLSHFVSPNHLILACKLFSGKIVMKHGLCWRHMCCKCLAQGCGYSTSRSNNCQRTYIEKHLARDEVEIHCRAWA